MEQKAIYTQWWFWLMMLVGGGAVLAIFHFVKKGLTNPQAQPQKYSYTDPATGETKTVSFAPEPYTDALYEAVTTISTWFIGYSNRDMTPFENLLKLGDGETVAVASDWNARHKKEVGETLRQAIRGEVLPMQGSKDVAKLIEDKFTRLNII